MQKEAVIREISVKVNENYKQHYNLLQNHFHPSLSKQAIRILSDSYLKKNKQGHTKESPEQFFKRVAKRLSINDEEQEFTELLSSLQFLPSPEILKGKEVKDIEKEKILVYEARILPILETEENTSIVVDDSFMRAVINNQKLWLNNSQGEKVYNAKAREIYDTICSSVKNKQELNIEFESNHEEIKYYGSINLTHMNKKNSINWVRLEKVCKSSLKLLKNYSKSNNKQVALSVMGWADLLVSLGIEYGSKEAKNLAQQTIKFIEKISAKENIQFQLIQNKELSIIASCSNGVGPLQKLAKEDKYLGKKLSEQLEQIARYQGYYSNKFVSEVVEEQSIQKMEDIPKEVKKIFLTTKDITPQLHLEMQDSFEGNTKFQKETTKNQNTNSIKRIIMNAWKSKSKNIKIK
jgi:ribonucleotide reductase alpha subunit